MVRMFTCPIHDDDYARNSGVVTSLPDPDVTPGEYNGPVGTPLPPAWQVRFPGLRIDHAGPHPACRGGCQRIEYGYPKRPHWKNSGTGWASVRIETQPDGSLHVIASESVNDDAGLLQKRKEVYFEVPKQVVEFIKARA